MHLDGSVGAPGSVLEASIQGLRLDSIDDLILDEQPFSGVISAAATVRGPFDDPAVHASVQVTEGSYRGFAYQRAGGTLDYAGQQLRLDLRIVVVRPLAGTRAPDRPGS